MSNRPDNELYQFYQLYLTQQEQIRKMTFLEPIPHHPESLSRRLKVAHPFACTRGTLRPPTEKLCPLRFEAWTERRFTALFASFSR
ncbi:hypothetical protein BO94DRAFT_535472 [Aspergillus sclerotioniger CBS 115572]|uniref:Uncharacterized protein n=1 Tax=Aspergillus sclerotioniger CBS 115572 TaxID=1450535 RepID=A0A317WLY9_9EURO|nr:hypothetical protein BO94DRAFT_535472 [Aspergillus sclerotioniger CBS 115572]PWY87359.1 hypothetical protein BO94DRAFT_535472 [Aspergillus sclerotioniger CBS 115572]